MAVTLVIVTIIFFLGLDWIVRHYRKSKLAAAAPIPNVPVPVQPLRIPDGVFFARSHTWLNLFPSGKARLGVDDFVSAMLDKPTVTLLRAVGDHVEKGDPLLRLEQEERSLTICSPIAGEIAALNPQLERSPELMHERLFSDGWAYTLKPEKPEEMRTFMLGDESRTWMQNELQRLRDLFAGAAGAPAPVSLQDGGMPVSGALKSMSAEEWKRFENEFLQVR